MLWDQIDELREMLVQEKLLRIFAEPFYAVVPCSISQVKAELGERINAENLIFNL
jgi:hypothetical protein